MKAALRASTHLLPPGTPPSEIERDPPGADRRWSVLSLSRRVGKTLAYDLGSSPISLGMASIDLGEVERRYAEAVLSFESAPRNRR